MTDRKESRTHNTGLAKVAVQCSADTFVVNQSLVLRINICGENRHLRQARNRQHQFQDDLPTNNSQTNMTNGNNLSTLDDRPFYHGTRADLKIGDLLIAGFKSNYHHDVIMNHIYFTASVDRKSTRLNSSHSTLSRMPSSA